MKTKEQILEWLDKQPWKNEFYENRFKYGTEPIVYDDSFIIGSFIYKRTPQGQSTWENRHAEYQKWYNSIDKPMSWEEYCEQNPIQEDKYFINNYSIIVPSYIKKRALYTDANIMSKELCEAFVAYMKLIQLKNAWIKDYVDSIMDRKIIACNNKVKFTDAGCHTCGLSFPSKDMAQEFIDTFKDLLEIAKPLL